MAKLTQIPEVSLRVMFTVSESEARALDALAGYGDNAFIEAFYKKLGRAYMEDHESGLRSFLKSIRNIMPGIIRRTDDARRAFAGKDALGRKMEKWECCGAPKVFNHFAKCKILKEEAAIKKPEDCCDNPNDPGTHARDCEVGYPPKESADDA